MTNLHILGTTLAGVVIGLAVKPACEFLCTNSPPKNVSDPMTAGHSGNPPQTMIYLLSFVGMALWGAYTGWQTASLPVAASALVVTAVLLCIALVDFQVRRIPNALVLALLVWAAMQLVWLGQPEPLAAVAGVLMAGGLFLLLRLVSRGAMGMGDVKLEVALGALLGFPAIVSAMFLGVIAGGLAAFVLLLMKRVGRKDPIAYGPYLALGAWIVLVQVWGLWPF